MRPLKGGGVKPATNAGGLNARACRAQMEELAEEAGLSFGIAIVEGDDLRGRAEEFAGQKEVFKGLATTVRPSNRPAPAACRLPSASPPSRTAR